jgi:predicted  nucleic acid-binding Zn-ribbon protein
MSITQSPVIRTLALVASMALAGTSVSRADTAHDQAQQAVAQAQADLTAAKARADSAQQALGNASARATDLASQLDAARQQASAIRQRMERGQAGLADIQAKIESASNIADAKHREMAVADLPYGSLKFADDKARLNAIQTFEQSPAYRAALAAVRNAGAGPGAIQAKAELDSLRSKFMEEELPQIPDVAFADRSLNAEQAHYDELKAGAAKAEKDLADARAQLDRQKAGLAGDQATLDQIAADVPNMEKDLASLRQAADQAADDASRATEYVRALQQTQDNAVASLQQLDAAQQIQQPVTTYEYAPPTVVYGQPGVIYSPGYYHGNVFVVPSRGGGYGGGYGGHSVSPQGHAFHGGGHR